MSDKRITEADKLAISKLLASGYYIILTGTRWSFKSAIVKILSLLLTGKWTKYSHALVNCDNITNFNDTESFKFIEAVPKYGVHLITFKEALDCDNICLLSPATVDNEEWTRIIDSLLTQQGKSYDSLYDLSNDTRVSCVELILNALKASDYREDFSDFDRLIRQTGNLVPQMFKDSKDFITIFEK